MFRMICGASNSPERRDMVISNDSPVLCSAAASILSCPRTIVPPRERNAESRGFLDWGPGGMGDVLSGK